MPPPPTVKWTFVVEYADGSTATIQSSDYDTIEQLRLAAEIALQEMQDHREEAAAAR